MYVEMKILKKLCVEGELLNEATSVVGVEKMIQKMCFVTFIVQVYLVPWVDLVSW